jgi:hypothetical protein
MSKNSIKSKYSLFFWVFFYLFIFCLLVRFGFSYLDPDLGWHLQVGRETLISHQVPITNHYNYTFTGNWVDHEWLSNVLLFKAYEGLGYPVIVFLFALIIVGVLIGLNLFIKKRAPSISGLVIAGLQLLGVVAALPHLGVRIQELSWLFLFLILLIIDRYEIKQRPASLLFLLPLMYFWACLHGSFLIGFFLIFAWIGVKIVELVAKRYFPTWPIDQSRRLSFKKIAIFGFFGLLTILVTLLTPYRLELYSFLGGYANTAYLTKIQEWLSQFFYPFFYWQLFYLALAVLALLAYLYEAIRHKLKKINLWALFLVLVFTVLAFKSRRHFPLMFVATLPFVATVYGEIIRSLVVMRKDNPTSNKPRRVYPVWLGFYIFFCLVLAISWQVINIRLVTDPFKYFCRDYPCGAYEFLNTHPEYQDNNIFNYYGWGGYLIWRLPNKKLFIDGRLPQVEYAGRTFLEEYTDFYKSDGQTAERLAKYNIKLVLMPASEPVIKAKRWEQILFALPNRPLTGPNYLREYLLSSKAWRLVYYDKTAIIFIKTE